MGIVEYQYQGQLFFVRDHNDQDHAAVHENIGGDPYHLALLDLHLHGETIVDIGGNIGTFTRRAIVEGARHVLAFEPEPGNAELYRMNCANLIDAGYVTFHELALSDMTLKHNVKIVQAQGGSAISADGTALVETISLNDALRGLADVHLLKMDIEGGELLTIEGASYDTLRKCRNIAMEYHEMTYDWGKMVRKLSGVFDLKIEGHDAPHENSGGMLFGTRRHNA